MGQGLADAAAGAAADRLDPNHPMTPIVQNIVYLGLPASLRERAEVLERMSADQPETLNIALNYGSHAEIVHAANELLREGVSEITEKALEGKLYTAHSPAPDLLIRTGGEYRLSNYLLWQLAYTELYFTDILWPDLTNDELDDIIREFYGRHRTYGGVTGEK